MKIKSIRIVLGIMVLALAQIACAAVTGDGGVPKSTEAPEATAAIQEQPAESSGCPAPDLGSPETSGYVEKIVMAKDTEGDNKDPVGPTTTFDGAATFHAVVSVKDAPEGTVFKAVWFADDTNMVADCNSQIDTYELTTDGTRNIDFTLAPQESWPVGLYRVQIYVNDTLEKNVLFKVK